MNDTVVFLLLAGVALFFKLLTRQRQSKAEKPPPPPSPNEPVRRAAPQTEEERVRRFLEALGVPAGTQPPPPVRPRTITPRPITKSAPPPPPKIRRSWVQRLPPVVTMPEETPQLPSLTTTPPAPAAVVLPLLPAELSAPPLAATVIRKVAAPLPMMSLRPLLRSREKIRQAIMLREILGPPRGLEPLAQFQGQ